MPVYLIDRFMGLFQNRDLIPRIDFKRGSQSIDKESRFPDQVRSHFREPGSSAGPRWILDRSGEMKVDTAAKLVEVVRRCRQLEIDEQKALKGDQIGILIEDIQQSRDIAVTGDNLGMAPDRIEIRYGKTPATPHRLEGKIIFTCSFLNMFIKSEARS